MKQTRIFIIILSVLVLVCSFQAGAENMPGTTITGTPPVPTIPPPPRLITVTGDAVLKVSPDDAVIIIGIEIEDPVLEVAKSLCQERAARLNAVAKSYKINVRTEPVSIEPRYLNSNEGQKKAFIGYRVRKTMEFSLKNDDNFNAIQTAMLGAGANYILGVQFRCSGIDTYKDQVRVQALKSARQKAGILAKELGCNVGKPYLVREEFVGWQSWYNAWWSSFKQEGDQQFVVQNTGWDDTFESRIVPGSITVRAVVSVSYEMQ